MDIINQAVTVTENLFGPIGANTPTFTWTVAEVPEPKSALLVAISMIALLAVRGRMRMAD